MGKNNTSFKKGQVANPNGRPKNPEMDELRLAIKAVEKRKGQKLLEHFVERAYSNNMVLVALMKKLIADQTASKIDGDLGLEVKGPLVVKIIK